MDIYTDDNFLPQFIFVLQY